MWGPKSEDGERAERGAGPRPLMAGKEGAVRRRRQHREMAGIARASEGQSPTWK